MTFGKHRSLSEPPTHFRHKTPFKRCLNHLWSEANKGCWEIPPHTSEFSFIASWDLRVACHLNESNRDTLMDRITSSPIRCNKVRIGLSVRHRLSQIDQGTDEEGRHCCFNMYSLFKFDDPIKPGCVKWIHWETSPTHKAFLTYITAE